MRVLGLDAGRDVGWAVLEVDPRGFGNWCADGVLRREHRLADLLDIVRDEPDLALVAVELPEGKLYGERHRGAVQHLLEATRIGSELAGHLQALGHRVLRCTANDWRSALRCRGTRGVKADHAVARMLRFRVRELPARTNTHIRDACGAALFAGLRALSERTMQARGVIMKGDLVVVRDGRAEALARG